MALVLCYVAVLRGALTVIGGIRTLKPLECHRILSANGLTIQLTRRNTQGAAAADNNFVSISQVIHRERFFAGRNALLLGE